MSLSIVLSPAAQEEFDEAVDWYEQQSAGLGVEFLNRVEESLDLISATPEAYPIVFPEMRRIVVRKFPYLIYYRVEPEQIVVLAIFHSKREPKTWHSRV
ncbi:MULTISPECIES: type II toxin-antitoxin system RelE/ParE family toxin [unclassified Microcoleus]|uniref:type II toxin-antitoxin system RelE/ParE family toxin n=1 Tax=unclassified Microcoleus TaxID=2642155 RepID=UPI002FCF5F7C